MTSRGRLAPVSFCRKGRALAQVWMASVSVLETILTSQLAQKLSSRAGAVIALIGQDALEIVTLGSKITANTPMEIGSLTKPFTALLLAEAIQRGELRPDTRIDELLFNERWEGEPITVKHLATHTSGLPRLSMPRWRLFLHPRDPYRTYTRDYLHGYLRRNKPSLPAQVKTAYSNLGFAVLGLALEKASAQTYRQLLQSRLLDPLKMHATGLHVSGQPDLCERGHRANGRTTSVWHFDAYVACGGMVSTLTDLITATRAFLNPAHPIAETLNLTLQPRAEMLKGSGGLAWMIPNKDWAWHNGATFGYTSYLGINRLRGAGVVILCNQYLSKQATELGHQIMRHIAEKSAEKQL